MITLQNFVFPEPTICTEHALYFRGSGPVGVSHEKAHLTLGPGARVTFDTYFNLFNLNKWNAACTLDGLWADISGQGRVELRVVHARHERSWELIYCEEVTMTADAPTKVDLSACIGPDIQGIVFIEIAALDAAGATLTDARFATASVPETMPRLAVSITTFKREAQVRETVARLEGFLNSFAFRDQVHVQVVDNGDSADIPASDKVTPIANPNYGGAGGFARGLKEATAAGFSHVLFMDDDASFHMENIARAYMFLALANAPDVAVAGAMINNTHKWAIWENGAWFDGSCHPMYCGLDLRNRDHLFDMEQTAARNRPETLYGGWWFFAFAIAEVKHHPFPFFVRGDDISFSLMNDFDIYTLNGVVSFQDDFSEKESAQTLYLDLRNHIIQHLVTPRLQRSALGTAKVPIRFIMRSLLRLHYESAQAQLLAWSDVMEGPDFFDENIDMAARRATIKAMMETEVWEPFNETQFTEKRRITWRSHHKRHTLGMRTLNGHLMPFSASRWDRIKLPMAERGMVFPAFGASRITYMNATRDKAYTVTQSKRKFWSICWEMTKTTVQFLRTYDELKDQYQNGYNRLTAPEYWQKKLP